MSDVRREKERSLAVDGLRSATMPTSTAKKTELKKPTAAKKSSMSAEHKAALAQGREEGRSVRLYLEALEAMKPRRGRRRTPDAIKKKLASLEQESAGADALSRLRLFRSDAIFRPN